MKKPSPKTLALTVIVTLLPLLAGAVVYGNMPEQIPIRWDANDMPIYTLHKSLALFGMPLFFALIQGGVCVCLWQTGKKSTAIPKIMTVAIWMLPLIIVSAYTMMILWAFGYMFSVSRIAGVMVGLVFLILGNYMPKISYTDSEHFVSIRFKNESSFRKAMKIIGAILILAGLAFFALSIFL